MVMILSTVQDSEALSSEICRDTDCRKILSGEVHTGDTLVLDVENGEYVVKVK